MADDHHQFQPNWWETTPRNRSFDNNPSSTDDQTTSTTTNHGWSSSLDLKSRAPSSMDDHSLAVSSSGVELHMMGLGLTRTSNRNLEWSSSNNQGLLGEKSESSFRQLIQDDGFEAGSSQELPWRLQRSALYSSSSSYDRDNDDQPPQSGFSSSSLQNLDINFGQQQQQVDSSATAYGGSSLLLSDNQYGNDDPLMASSHAWNKYNQQNFLRMASHQPNNKQQLHFANNAPFWNATAGVNSDPRPSFVSTQNIIPIAPLYDEKPKVAASEVATTTKKNSTAEASNKRPRNESSSSLPAFKVRKEKMGDRITALQQLVSPFGKTDTASVLSEAIQYIKFLHEQVSVLSTPYMKKGNPPQHHQISEKSKDQEGTRQDLRSRGLCLVPISSTFPMTHESTVDFWTPTFGGTFR